MGVVVYVCDASNQPQLTISLLHLGPDEVYNLFSPKAALHPVHSSNPAGIGVCHLGQVPELARNRCSWHTGLKALLASPENLGI